MPLKHPKQKGNRGEREFAKFLINSELDAYAMRMPTSGAIGTITGNTFFNGDIKTNLPFTFEIKNTEKARLWAHWSQAKEQEVFGNPAILAYYRAKGKFLVCMAEDTFADLVLNARKNDQ